MVTEDIRWQQRFSNFEKALKQIINASELAKQRTLSDLERQGLIQAFEYTHELIWKTLKDFLEFKGNKDIYGSRDATRKAFKLGLIVNGDIWMDMIKNRNQTSHTYNEETAEKIANVILSNYINEFIIIKNKLNALKATTEE